MATRTTLAFVDHEYVLTDGAAGSIVLDCNDGTDYAYMLDTFMPRPAPQRQQLSDSPLTDGRTFHPGLDKLESVMLPFSIKIMGTDPDDKLDKAIDLLNAARDHHLHVVFSPPGSDVLTFYNIIPAPEFDTDRVWRLGYETTSIIDFEIEASCGYGTKRYLYPLKNIAPNPSFELWNLTAIADWVSTVAGGSTIASDAGTKFHGSLSVKMVRGTGNCFMTSAAVPVTELLHHGVDFRVHSVAAVSVTVTVEAFATGGASLGTFPFAGNTRGASVFDRHCACLYAAGTTATPGTFALPATTATATIKIALNTNSATIYVDCCYLAETENIPGHVGESIFGLVIPDAEGDLPAPCEMTFGSPFAPAVWATEDSGVLLPSAVYALDATNVWVVGFAGQIGFYNSFGWANQTSGVSSNLLGVTAFDATHQWAVGHSGPILFGNGTTWAAQAYPLSNPTFPDRGFEGTFGTYWWTTTASPALYDVDIYRGGNYPRTGSWDCEIEITNTQSHAVALQGDFVSSRTTNMATINPAHAYTVKSYYQGGSYSGDTCYLVFSVLFYDVGDNLLGQKASARYYKAAGYTQMYVAISPLDYPAGTVKIGVRVTDGGTLQAGNSASWYLDDYSVTQIVPNLFGVHAIAANNIIAVGDNGTIIKSANGTTWTEKVSGVTTTLRAVHASDSTHIYAVGDNGTILFSADGTTWTPMTSGTMNDLYGVWACDTTHVWVVGRGGTILFWNGTTWTAMNSGTGYDLFAVDGVDATHVYVAGEVGTILLLTGGGWLAQASGLVEHSLLGISIMSTSLGWAIVADGAKVLRGIGTSEPVPVTQVAIGQRDNEYSDGFNPVLHAPATGTLAYNIYRHGNCYRALDAGVVIDFLYNLLAHAGNDYAVSVGISFSAATAYDKGTLRTLLQTIDGTVITSQYKEDIVDLGDPNTVWKESLFLADTWDDTPMPSSVVSVEALLQNIDQVARLIAHASLAAVKLWIDHMAIVPTDRWTQIDDIACNYLIVNSTQGEVFDSKDGSPSTAMAHDPTDVDNVPRFYINPSGTNMTIVGVQNVGSDMRRSLFDLAITYRPRTKLYLT